MLPNVQRQTEKAGSEILYENKFFKLRKKVAVKLYIIH